MSSTTELVSSTAEAFVPSLALSSAFGGNILLSGNHRNIAQIRHLLLLCFLTELPDLSLPKRLQFVVILCGMLTRVNWDSPWCPVIIT
jgi:hypothetical protein